MFKDLNKLTTLVVWSQSALLAVTVASAISTIFEMQLLHTMVSGTFASGDQLIRDATASDDRQQLLAYAYMALFALSGILALVWIHRAASNTLQLSALPRKISPGWAVGWFFIPIANLWKPFQGMRETWQRSAWPQTERAPDMLGLWWGLWLLNGVLGQASLRLSMRAEELPELQLASTVSLVSDVAFIPSILIFIWLVRQIWRMQAARHAGNPSEAVDHQILQDTVPVSPPGTV